MSTLVEPQARFELTELLLATPLTLRCRRPEPTSLATAADFALQRFRPDSGDQLTLGGSDCEDRL